MRKINILSKNIYNRIAAGEVVDRPYSVVKELLENSIDAKATEIEIHIEKGGKQLVKIIDNGGGIERDDMRAAFLPHATSKICSVQDLDAIFTLGFRGEALASIASVAKVELISVTEGNTAYKTVCEGGVMGEICPAALEMGTEISVHNLFFNTPVRAKFLKSDRSEETDITNFVTRYILGYPEISFKYYIDGKLKLQSFGGGLDEALAQVYGAKVLDSCFKLDAERNGIKLRGFIGNQNFFKSNKTYQSLFLNGRYIFNNTVSTAITNAYASYMMKRQYPFYVLFLDVPVDTVDVNVHPNKADVRFSDSRTVFGAVYTIISSVLDGKATIADFVVNKSINLPDSESNNYDKDNNFIENLNPYKSENCSDIVFNGNTEKIGIIEPKRKIINTYQIKDEDFHGKRSFYKMAPTVPISSYFKNEEKQILSITDEYLPPDVNNDIVYALDEGKFAALQQKIEYDSYKYKGNLFNTYLIYEFRDDAFLIDQHAAHERLLYDKLREAMAARKVIKQPLLLPYYFDVNEAEAEFLDEVLPYLSEIGFDIRAVSTVTYNISAIPSDLSAIQVKDFIEDVLANMAEFKSIAMVDLFKEKLATCACKHAIKGGMELTDKEVDRLFEKLKMNFGLKCPHGRPVCVKLTKTAVEKMFKRIV